MPKFRFFLRNSILWMLAWCVITLVSQEYVNSRLSQIQGETSDFVGTLVLLVLVQLAIEILANSLWMLGVVRPMNPELAVSSGGILRQFNALCIENTRTISAMIYRLPLFLIPAAIEFVRLAYVSHVVIFEKDYWEGSVDALTLSRELTRGQLIVLGIATSFTGPGWALISSAVFGSDRTVFEAPGVTLLVLGINFLIHLGVSYWIYRLYIKARKNHGRDKLPNDIKSNEVATTLTNAGDQNDIPHRGRGLTFDDVLLMPRKSDIRSRREPSLSTRLTKNLLVDLPIISANMDTVTESSMAIAMHRAGGLGILHRFMSIEEQVRQVQLVKESGAKIISASIGVNDDDHLRAEAIVKAGVNVITIDIAHGHSVQMLETMKWLKDKFPKIDIIAGNIATAEGAIDLIEAGATAIKVGIGPGSMCTTRVITGCGVPQLSAIALCAEVGIKYGVPVIADGGIKSSGDIVKAFAAGASSVMLGSMLSGTIETPGDIKSGRKQYRGMASKSAQISWRGGVPNGMAAEGESTMVGVKGHVLDVLLELSGGIRSGMSYLNANAISELREQAIFMEMSGAGFQESRAHGLS
jgi:IMP dehydrogenase